VAWRKDDCTGGGSDNQTDAFEDDGENDEEGSGTQGEEGSGTQGEEGLGQQDDDEDRWGDGEDGGDGGEHGRARTVATAQRCRTPLSKRRRVGTTSRKSVAFPELHLLFGGYLHDAIRDHDVPSGDSAAAFEARHVSAR
jgi:hypothetical protein